MFFSAKSYFYKVHIVSGRIVGKIVLLLRLINANSVENIPFDEVEVLTN